MRYPEMFAVRQAFPREHEPDPAGAVRREIARVAGSLPDISGSRVAITGGSRGIANIAVIMRSVVDALRGLGAIPFIFPAMGSHGGGTAEGQAGVLAHYGITPEVMGCPVLSSMEVERIGESPEGVPVFLDRHAAGADHVVVLNRVKPHTEFKGEIESGIMKMMLIGMGKREGAEVYHRAFADFGFDRLAETLARVVIGNARVIFALASVENAREETALVRALLPGEIVEGERALLRRAKELAPRLPFDEIDLLIVDEMGKNISGAGMDTNVIGRFYNQVASEPARPRIKRIYVRSLTPESMGNATGIGLADYAHRDVVDRMDARATMMNCLTACNPEKARIPIVCENDGEALEFCFNTIGLRPPEEARVVRIQNTLRLLDLDISGALEKEARERDDLRIRGGPEGLALGAGGRLMPMIATRREESE